MLLDDLMFSGAEDTCVDRVCDCVCDCECDRACCFALAISAWLSLLSSMATLGNGLRNFFFTALFSNPLL